MNLLFFQLNSLSFLSLFLYARDSLNHLSGLSLALLQLVHVSSQLHVQSLWRARCLLSLVLNTERRITSPHLLPMCFLMQCRQMLAVFATGTHQFKVSCLSTLTPGPSFRAASQPVVAKPVQVPGVTSPLMQDLISILFYWASQDFCQPVSPLVQVPLHGSTLSWSIIHSSQFCFLLCIRHQTGNFTIRNSQMMSGET